MVELCSNAFKEVRWGVVDRIDLAQDGDQRRAVLKSAMRLGAPQNIRNSSVADELAASQEGLSSKESAR